MVNPDIRAVLFDADGVLQTTPPEFRLAIETLCGDPARVEDFVADVFVAEKPCLTGAGDFEQALAAVLHRWQSPATLAEALKVWEIIEPSEDLFEIVAGLRSSGTLVALATNQQASRAQYMTDGLGYGACFDALFISCEIGHAKPSREYFEHIQDTLELGTGQVLFIDDHPANVAAARAMGLNAEVYELQTGVQKMNELLERYRLPGALL